MNEIIRLDKYLSDMGIGTRSEVKNYIRKGRVQVDGVILKDPNQKINWTTSNVLFDNSPVTYITYEYYMLNKPAGIVSATRDNFSKTVVDLIKEKKCRDLFPVGRLDKDTEGLLLLTNDGDLAHQLLSPKRHVDKVYFAKIKGKVTEDDIKTFLEGINIYNEYTTLPAKLEIMEALEVSTVLVTIQEGKFHQIKRMFQAIDMEVIYLKRLRMGPLELDVNLNPGEYRKLTEEEINNLKTR